jgi:beta-phosphoglucomutase-like phosphatase (HAD superfamily)
VRLLVLLDVDGTIFLTHDPLAGRALRETLQERFAVRLPEDAVERIDHLGQTSLRIGRLVLTAAGVDPPTVDAASQPGVPPSPRATSTSSPKPTRAASAPLQAPKPCSRS